MARNGLRVALALALTFAGARAAASEAFAPDGKVVGSMTLVGRTWSSEGPTHAMRIQSLDDGERVRYLEHVTGVRVDPFRSPAAAAPRFLTFLVELENRGDAEASFNPQDCWLVVPKDDVLYPIGLEDLATIYRQFESDLPEAYNAVRRALLDQRTTVAPGGALAGLLVYHGLEPNAQRFQVDLQLTLATGDVVRASAPYRRPK